MRKDSRHRTASARRVPVPRESGWWARAAVAAVVVALCGPAFGAAPSATAADDESGIGIEIVDDDAATSSDLRARSYLIDDITPGGHLERTVRVVNDSREDRRVHVYSGPAEIRDGVFAVDDPSGPDISEWIVPGKDTLDLRAGESTEMTVAIDLPRDAPEGEFYGAVWAELRSPSPDGSLTIANRVGVRVYLSVGSGDASPPDFTISNLRLDTSADTAELRAEVANTGSTAVDLTGAATLTSVGGAMTLGPLPSEMLTLAPGQAGTAVFRIPNTPTEGTWSTQATLTSGIVSRTAHGDVESLPVPAQATTEKTDEPPLLWILLIAGAFIAALILLVVRARLRRRE